MTNVVLLVLDTVRKDYFDEHAPRLRAMADGEAESVTIPDRALAEFGEGLETLLDRVAASESSAKIDEAATRRLEDLGYKV